MSVSAVGTFAIDIARFPLWLVTRGALRLGRTLGAGVQDIAATLAVGVWTRNLWVPMFGAWDWQSRIISFFMRLVQIIARGVALCVTMLAAAIAWLALLLAPFAALGLIVWSLLDL